MPTEIERLYREHRAGLVRLVEGELRDHHEAEDVVQTAFLDAQRALERGTIPRNPRAWLAAIALNAARRLRRRRLNAEPLEEYAVQEASGLSDLREALASLPKGQRAAVLYRDLLGLSYGETADRMGTTVNAVTMLLHRGRLRLRQSLGITAAGAGLWRWLKRAGLPQVAAAKGATAVVVAAGLATAGVVAARVVAPLGADATAAPGPPSSGAVAARALPGGGARAPGAARRRFASIDGTSTASAASVESTTSGPSTIAAARPSQAPATLRPPTVSPPTVSLPTLSVPTVSATVTVPTPITTATVTAPPGTTATVTTPLVTVTVPVP